MLRKWHTGVLGTEGTRSGQQPIKAYIILQIITYSNKRPNTKWQVHTQLAVCLQKRQDLAIIKTYGKYIRAWTFLQSLLVLLIILSSMVKKKKMHWDFKDSLVLNSKPLVRAIWLVEIFQQNIFVLFLPCLWFNRKARKSKPSHCPTH